MKKKIIRAAAAILVLTVALSFAFSGCSNKKDGVDETTTMPPEAVEAVQTLKLPYSKGDKLNPFTATSMLNQQLMPLIYDGLFALDKNYNPQPLLASNYSRSGRTLTVSLASAKFSDGSSVSASDVVASFESAKKSPAYKTQLANFSTYSSENGVGYLKASGARGNFSPKKTSITLYDVKDLSMLKYTLAIGNISFAFDDLRGGSYTRYSSSVADILMNNLVYLAFNKSSSALSSEKVRQAVALAIDRAKLADESFQGHAKAAYTPFNPDWNVISGKDYTVKTDLEAAGKLLDEAGYTSKNDAVRADANKKQLTLKIVVNKDNGFKSAAAQSIKEMLEKLKISVTVSALSEKDYRSAVASGKYDMYIGEVKLTENMSLSPLLKSGGSVAYGINTSGAASTAYSAFLAGSSDVNTFIDAFNADMPFVPLCYRSGLAIYTRTMKYGNANHINDVYADIDSWDFH